MKIKMNDNYQNQFVTTMRGFTILKDEVKEMDYTDRELKYYLEQGILVVVPEEKHLEEKQEAPVIIKDVPKIKEAIKEIVNEDNNPKQTLKKTSFNDVFKKDIDMNKNSEKIIKE